MELLMSDLKVTPYRGDLTLVRSKLHTSQTGLSEILTQTDDVNKDRTQNPL